MDAPVVVAGGSVSRIVSRCDTPATRYSTLHRMTVHCTPPHQTARTPHARSRTRTRTPARPPNHPWTTQPLDRHSKRPQAVRRLGVLSLLTATGLEVALRIMEVKAPLSFASRAGSSCTFGCLGASLEVSASAEMLGILVLVHFRGGGHEGCQATGD